MRLPVERLFCLALLLHAAPAVAAPPAGGGTSAPASSPRRWQSAPPRAGTSEGDCRESATSDEALDASLRALVFKIGEDARPLADLRLAGLATIEEARLWEAVGGKPEKADAERAALILRRLSALGIFSSISPAIDLAGGGAPVLVLTLVEHPTVRKVVFEGLGELSPERLLRALLDAPSNEDVERSRVRSERGGRDAGNRRGDQDGAEEKARQMGEKARAAAERWSQAFEEGWKGGRDGDGQRRLCPDPLPPRDWLARAEGEVIFPGIVWRGLDGALERLAEEIWERGYEMAEIGAELSADGTLDVRIDEGRIEEVELYGVAPRLEERVRAALGITAGRPFVRGDIDGAAQRLGEHFPFLRPDRAKRPTRQRSRVARDPASPLPRYRTVPRPPSEERRWITVAGRSLALHVRAQRWTDQFDLADLVRHTPVTGFAPGLNLRGTLWDPGGRVHLGLYGGGNVNTRRARTPAEPGAVSDRWRTDWRGGAQLSVPDLRIAELGIEGYGQVDTNDRWRMDDLDSYIYSMLMNRPGQESFRRSGLTGFFTVHLARHFTAGVEYRWDRYRSLRSSSDVPTLFNRDEPPAFTPPITPGRMGSLLLRLEASTLATPVHQVGPMRRNPERSLHRQAEGQGSDDRYWWTELRTLNTLEIADRSLGADDQLTFTRLVSDSAAFLRTGHRRGLKLRFRAAGALGDGDLPLQKQEALGGFTALRGYAFKELRGGSFSLLGTAEYRADELSLFVDVASLRAAGEFGRARTGLGAALNFSDGVRLDVAWRVDDQARWRPELRLLFRRTY